VLIALRALQAIGAAMITSNSPAILTRTFPPEQRGRALGALGTFTYLGLTVGPSLGGWLTGAFGWRSIFYINVPIGGLALLAGFAVLPRSTRQKDLRIDVVGALIAAAGMAAVIFSLVGQHHYLTLRHSVKKGQLESSIRTYTERHLKKWNEKEHSLRAKLFKPLQPTFERWAQSLQRLARKGGRTT